MKSVESVDLKEAYAHCEQIAKGHYENFPVASHLLPAKLRPHVAAIYAFARTADDFADEPGYHASERMRLLRDWRAKLHPPSRPGASAGQVLSGDDQIFIALHDTIDRFSLPMQLFDDLLNAFVQDVGTTRYSTWADVLDYCRRSANPVGRLVLRLSGYHDARLDAASDAVCTALQLTNFWQDLAIDWSRGRLYVPEEIWRAHDADVASLDANHMTPQWTAALADCGAADARPVRARAAGVRRRLRTAALRAARDVARRDAHSRPARERGLRRVQVRPAETRSLRRISDSVWNAVVARDTSFSYSFLVLPAAQRRAIGVVWDFCRAVDDAVDEAPDPATAARRSGEVARGSGAALRRRHRRVTPQAQNLKPLRRAVLAVAAAVRRPG